MAKDYSQPLARPSRARWLGTLLALALLIYLLGQQGWQSVFQAVRQIAWWRFILCLGLMMISRLAVIGRWHVLLRSGGVSISIQDSTRLTFAGLFASNFLPTTIGGDVVRLAGAMRLGFDQAITLASLIVDRLVGMAGMAIALLTLPWSLPTVGLAVFSIHPVRHSPPVPTSPHTWPLVLTNIVSLPKPNRFFSIHMLNSGFMVAPQRATSGRLHRLREQVMQTLQRIFRALKLWVKHPMGLLVSLTFTWLHMLVLFLQIQILLEGMGEPLSFWLIAGLWAATYFITLLPVSINGIGLQELSATFFYSTLGGISSPSSLTLSLLIRILLMLASLPGAVFIPGILAGEKKRSEKDHEDQ
jgi:hypothetical protein